jgi:site-specific DNA-methyltransferase (adenine-specific)
MNIGKMVDKRMGVERESLGIAPTTRDKTDVKNQVLNWGGHGDGKVHHITEATSPQAKALDGSYGGFQPKPAVEVIIVCMKPLSEKTYVDQALTKGKGVTWLDDCRVPTNGEQPKGSGNDLGYHGGGSGTGGNVTPTTGRFPANLLVSDDILNDGKEQSYSRFFSLDNWWSERLKSLPESVQKTFPFLIVPKASKREKNEGLGGFDEKQVTGGGGLTAELREDGSLETASAGGKFGSVKAKQSNTHSTVKPLTLMSYLITLGSRPGDTVLDPFVGSGTTVCAAKALGRNGIGIEREEEYAKIAEARVTATSAGLL